METKTRMTNEQLQEKYGPEAKGIEKTVYLTYLLGQNIIFGVAMTALQTYWQFTLMVPIGAIGIIFLIARLWDAINDPILGGIVQRSNPRNGKFKIWTFVIAFALPIMTMLIFVNINPNKDLGTVTVIMYAAVTYILWGMTYTLCDVPIFSLSMTMEPDTKKRSGLLLLGRVGAGIAGIFTSFIFFGVSGALDAAHGGSWAWSQTIAIAILMIAAMVTMAPIYLAKERNIPEETTTPPTLKTMFVFIKSNDHLIKLLGGFTVVMLLTGVFMAAIPTFLFNGGFEAANPSSWLTILMTFGGVVGLVNTFIVMALIPRLGKRKTIALFMFTGAIIMVLGMIVTPIAGYQAWTLLFYITGGYCIMMTPIVALGLFTSECIEYAHYKTGLRQEAVGFSSQTFISKFGMAIGGFTASIAMLIAGVVTFDAGTASPELIAEQAQAARNLYWVACVCMLIAAVLGIILFTKIYNLSSKDAAFYAEENKKHNKRFDDAKGETPAQQKNSEKERKAKQPKKE